MAKESGQKGWTEYEFELTGVTELFMDKPTKALLEVLRDKTKKKPPKTDWTPEQEAATKIYRADGDGSEIVIPRKWAFGAFCNGAKSVKVPGTKRNLNGAAGNVLPSYIRLTAPYFSLILPQTGVNNEGWEVDQRKGNQGKKDAKVAVCITQPRFDTWTVKGKMLVNLDETTVEVVLEVLKKAGNMAGFGPQRPGLGGTGCSGMFEVTKFEKAVQSQAEAA